MGTKFHNKCRALLEAYKSGKLGQTRMPEDSNPGFDSHEGELKIAYFTLPMALNYQRDSYKLWEAALNTYNDPETKFVFNIEKVCKVSENELRVALTKYKLALQPNKHIRTWKTLARTIYDNWSTLSNLFKNVDNDFLKLRQLVELDYKKGFPYLSGPKIFNYWSFIVGTYGGVKLNNRDFIEIAPDTHITQCSVKLRVITKKESENLTKDDISLRWRKLLAGSGISPIDMHPPLWFWSRNGFIYNLD